RKGARNRAPHRLPTLLGASFLGRRVIERRGRSPWTRPGPGAHEIEPGRGGTPAIANSGSPGSWASPRANRRRVMRASWGQTEFLVFSVVQINLQLGLPPGPRLLPAGEKVPAGPMRRRAPAGKPSLTPSLSPRAEGDRWSSPPRDFGSFSKSLSRNAL